MEHVVFFTAADGAAQYRRTPSLQEAVRVVEHLRNADGVEGARVYSLTEVPLTVKAVYKVELPAAQPGAPEPLPPLPPMPAMPDLAVPTPAVEPTLGGPVAASQPAAQAGPAPVAAVAAEDEPEHVAPVLEMPAEPAAEAPAEPSHEAEPVMAAVPSEPYEAPADAPSNGKPAARGMGFFSR